MTAFVFSRDLAAQRDLLCLEEDPHAAASNRPRDPKVAELVLAGPPYTCIGVGPCIDLSGQAEHVQTGPQPVGDRVMAGRKAVGIDELTRLDRGEVAVKHAR